MRLTLVTLALAPVLFGQGKRVKKNMLRLPEPVGERAGIVGTGQPLRLLILGDSAAAGVGVETQQQALSGQLVQQLSQHYQVHWRLEASTGHTSEEVIERIKSQIEPQPYDVVVTSVGVNDVTRLVSPKKWIGLQQQLLQQIRHKFQPKLILLTSVPPMHLFSALPQPLRWHLGSYVQAMNKALAELLKANPECVQITLPLEQGQGDIPLANDGFHPSAEVYQAWATLLAGVVGGWIGDFKVTAS